MPRKAKPNAGQPAGKRPKRQRKAEVLKTAVQMFNDRGYASTSVGDIAEALGILKGSLYYYIDSKEDLLFEIVDEVHQDVRRTFGEALEREDLKPLERLSLFIRKQTEYNARNVTRIAVYYRDLDQLGEDRLANIKSRQAQHYRALVSLISEIVDDGEIPPTVDPALAARGVLGTMIWIYTWYRPGSKVKPETLAEFNVAFVLGGLCEYGRLATPSFR